MLRITTHGADGVLEVKLEGCLSGRSAGAAAACWRQVTRIHRHASIRVDLTGVCQVDEQGRRLLARMHARGASFVTSGCLMPEIVREISGIAEAAPVLARRS